MSSAGLDLAPGFVPLGTFFSSFEEVLGALSRPGFSAMQMANTWSVKGGPSVSSGGVATYSVDVPKLKKILLILIWRFSECLPKTTFGDEFRNTLKVQKEWGFLVAPLVDRVVVGLVLGVGFAMMIMPFLRGFESKRARERGNGVKEKQSTTGDPTKVIVYVIDEPVVKEKKSSLVDTSILDVKKTSLRSYPPLLMQGSNPAGNTPGMSSYVNVICEPSRKALNFRTLFTPGGNGVDVVVPVESIRAISERFANIEWVTPLLLTMLGTLGGKYSMVKSMLNSSTGLFSFQFSSMDGLNAMLENGPWFIRNHPLTLKSGTRIDDGLSAIAMKLGTLLMLDLITTYNVLANLGACTRMSRAIERASSRCEVEHTIEWLMPKLTGEGRSVQRIQTCFKKPTANTSGNKKKGVEPTKEGTSNLARIGANSSVSSFWNVETSSTSTTPVVDKIEKLEKLIIDQKVTLVDDDGKPLKKVDYSGDHDSEDDVESIDNDMARSMASESVGFGTKSLLEQWRDS
ncbi:hypothetical protein Tco_0149800 [Tanacetum coccineum]